MDEITRQMLRLQRFVGSARITKSELARRANLPITTLIGMEDPGWNPKAATLAALVRALDGLDDSVAVKKNAKLRRLVASAA